MKKIQTRFTFLRHAVCILNSVVIPDVLIAKVATVCNLPAFCCLINMLHITDISCFPLIAQFCHVEVNYGQFSIFRLLENIISRKPVNWLFRKYCINCTSFTILLFKEMCAACRIFVCRICACRIVPAGYPTLIFCGIIRQKIGHKVIFILSKLKNIMVLRL